MKRKLLLFATFVAAVLPSNAAFYLSGTYNNGSSSNNDLKDCLFVDDDGDGIFTYTLNLDNGYLEKFSVWDSDQSKRIGNDCGIRSGETIKITCDGKDNIHSIDPKESVKHADFFFDNRTDEKKITMVVYDYPMYLRCKDNWGMDDNLKMTYTPLSGKYTITIDSQFAKQKLVKIDGDGGSGFKISGGYDGSWDNFFGTGSEFSLSTPYDKKAASSIYHRGNNGYVIFPVYDLNDVTITFDAVEKTIKAEATPVFYLRGMDGDYSCRDANRFEPYEGQEGVFVLRFGEQRQLTRDMKVASGKGNADGNWDGTLNFGSAYGTGKVLKLQSAQQYGDFAFNGSVTTDVVYFAPFYDADGNLAGNIYAGLPDNLYILGLGEWTPQNMSKMLDKFTRDGVYHISGVEVNNDEALTFRICDANAPSENEQWNITSWGYKSDNNDVSDLDEDMEYKRVATFHKGDAGNMKVPTGKYASTFNIFNGEILVVNEDKAKSNGANSEDLSGTDEVADDSVKVSTIGNVIRIYGATETEIYGVSGVLLARNVNEYATTRGIYLIKADNKVIKVVVR